MADSGVIRVQCHSHSHGENWRRYRDEQSAIVDDAERCRERLEEQLGYRSRHICWPRGHFTPALFDWLQQRGFAFQYSTLRGVNDLRSPDTRILRRIHVSDVSGEKLIAEIDRFSSSTLAALYNGLQKCKMSIYLGPLKGTGGLMRWLAV